MYTGHTIHSATNPISISTFIIYLLCCVFNVCRPEGYSQSVVSVNCSGAEGNLNDCSIEISNTTDNCTDLASMECGELMKNIHIFIIDSSNFSR